MLIFTFDWTQYSQACLHLSLIFISQSLLLPLFRECQTQTSQEVCMLIFALFFWLDYNYTKPFPQFLTVS